MKEGKVAFCQYMKKSEILIVTEDNSVIIFHTKNFEIFEKQIQSDQIDTFVEKFQQNLEGRTVTTIPGKKSEHFTEGEISK